MAKKKIAVLTGGGDAPGLNAVIYALVRACHNMFDCEMIGYLSGYRGLYTNDYIPLTVKSTSGILHKGGTILYSSNKDNLFDYTLEIDGVTVKKDVSDIAMENMQAEEIDVLVILGGDGTLTSARDFARKGVNVIGIPKTIDNDLASTEVTFGFDSAVNVVTENLGRLHTTAESHHRVFVVEVMGRTAGWIALQSGLAGSADVILIPEIPYKLERIIERIKQRDMAGRQFTIIVVTEGARPADGEAVVGKIVEGSPDPIRYGGIAAKIAHDLEASGVGSHEVRSVSLGHIQRGGETSPSDRVLSARYAVKAAELIEKGLYGNMVCIKDGKMDYVSLEEVIGQKNKLVQPDGELIKVARRIGISFADE